MIVDSHHVEPVDPMRWDELRYRPHVARYGEAKIVVLVRDRELSDAQESGMEASWFIREVQARTRPCDFTPLVTTCTDVTTAAGSATPPRAPTSGPLSTPVSWTESADAAVSFPPSSGHPT